MDALTSPLLAAASRHVVDTDTIDAELTALMDLALARAARTITIGSGRTPMPVAAAAAIAARWKQVGGSVTATVTWPETAASWLRQADRFCQHEADLWIMTGPAEGWAQMTRRLLWTTQWNPASTLATSSVGTMRALELVGLSNLEGLAGATAAGTTWTVASGNLLSPAPAPVRGTR